MSTTHEPEVLPLQQQKQTESVLSSILSVLSLGLIHVDVTSVGHVCCDQCGSCAALAMQHQCQKCLLPLP